ncbi:MAG: hypothetical protein LC768_11420 [Acidobacteria bacterium]|nr:hypothetical protein [Acidobacteriota bacterium]
MKKNSFLLILLVLGTLTIDVLAQKGKPAADTPVTTRINDSYIVDSISGSTKDYRIKSDGRVYTNVNGLVWHKTVQASV